MWWLTRVIGLAVLALGVGCGGNDVVADDAGEADDGVDAPPECEGPPALERPTGAPHAEPLRAGVGEARAGILRATDLPPDPERLLTWRVGDLVLANDRVAVVVEAARPSDGYDPHGGKVAGFALVEAGALVAPADFNELVPGLGRFTLDPEVVGVFADGSDGGPAIIRAVGPLRPIPAVAELGRALIPGEYDDLVVAVDYVLAPGATHVDVVFHVASPRRGPTRAQLYLLGLQTYRMSGFVPERGFDVPTGMALPWIGYERADLTSYATEASGGTLTLLLEQSGVMVFNGPRHELDGCAITEVPMLRVHLGGPGADGLQAAMRAEAGVAQRMIEGVVRDGSGAPAAGVRVHAESADGARWLSRALTDADGRYALRVAASEADVRLRAFRVGEGIVDFPAGAADLDLPAVGFVDISVTDGVGPIPVRIQTEPRSYAEPAVPRRWGELARVGRRTHVVFPSDGRARLPLAPGTHRIYVSRGFEYELFESDVSIVAGETVELPIVLERVVDTTGAMCADYHIHTNRSPDSEDPARFKLHTAAADGLEIPCRSEHEWVSAWDDLVQEEGLAGHVFGVTSLELTTFAWGHFGVLPLTPRPDEINAGAIGWFERLPPEVFQEVRERPEEPLIIINHPRATAVGGYFSAVRYDNATGSVGRPEYWDEGFGAIEVFNNSSFDESSNIVADWFSMLRSGRRVWGVGSSDSHNTRRGSPVGYPRTCLHLGVDDPEALRAAGGANAVRDATASGRFTVSGGIYVDAEARGGVGPGGEVTGAMAAETVRVRVQAAPWVAADVLEVWIDGALAESIALEPTTEVVRFDEEIEVSGGWVLFHAKGEGDLAPIFPGRAPFGVTQPIFFVP
ncbi:MAG: CehA/McbA family metallohydrolase [Myxococcales bacterium]|nr:CehA/McbA family metallohydrolase [Myxococcales bacterium]